MPHETAPTPPSDLPPALPPNRPHVLVVDDEPQIRTLLALALRREGYAVTACEDGRAGLEALQQHDVQVLLTDLKMPHMDGLALIRAAKERRPDLASILITAYASTETAVEALRHGADDYLAKPFQVDDLRRVVDRALTARRLGAEQRRAGVRARDEAEEMRTRSAKAEKALAQAKADLTLSRGDLERRVRDLEFVGELTRLLAGKSDLERVLSTSTRILATRFAALGVRIEVGLEDGARVAQHVSEDLPTSLLPALSADLVGRAQSQPDKVLRDLVLGPGKTLEALAAALSGPEGLLGGLTVVRDAPPREDPGDLFLLRLVAPTLTMAVEADLQRRAAEQGALDVALGMLEVLEGRGGLAPGHASRVADLSLRIAERMSLSPRLKRVIEVAARLHDVGEVGVPDSLLQRAGPLNADERRVVEGHSLLGARLLAPFGEAASFVRHHHERYDGRGYPDGLRGEEIPLGAAIVGAAEAFDAMTHARPYRPSRSRKDALEEVRAQRGIQFMPDVADALLDLPAGTR